jgi:hypothetical protein
VIALRMRRAIETSSGFIIDRRDLGGPRSAACEKFRWKFFFGAKSLMGTPLSCRDSNPNSISIPLSAQREKGSLLPVHMGFIGRVVAIFRPRTVTHFHGRAYVPWSWPAPEERSCTELTTSKVASSVQPTSCVTTPSSGIARSPFDLLWKGESE